MKYTCINFNQLRLYLSYLFFISFCLIISAQSKETLENRNDYIFLNPVVDKATYEEYEKISSEVYSNLDKIPFYYGSVINALNYHLQTLEWLYLNGTEDEIFLSKKYLLKLYTVSLIDDKIIETAIDLLNYPEVENNSAIVEILYTLKEAYRRNEQFEDLIKILPKYHEFSKKFGYQYRGEKSLFIDVAYAHYSLKNYDQAVNLYKESAKEKENEGDYFYQSSALNNVGTSFYGAKKNDSATFYFDKALALISNKRLIENATNDYVKHFVNVINSNKARILLDHGDAETTLPYFVKELNSGKKFSEFNIVVGAYYNIARIYYLKR